MADSAVHPLLDEIADRLSQAGTADATLHAVLDRILDWFACVAGTVHDFDGPSGVLRLRAQRNIPDVVRERARLVPIGKGMAGLAAERLAPVQVCNLQTDVSGAARPAARATGMEGCIAVPMLVGGTLRGVLGVAKPDAYEYDERETGLLLRAASAVGAYLGQEPA